MTIHAPVPDYEAARASMVDAQLRPEGVNYAPVVEAMAAVKREDFVSDDARPLAYIDRMVPMGDGRQLFLSGRRLGPRPVLAGPSRKSRGVSPGCSGRRSRSK